MTDSFHQEVAATFARSAAALRATTASERDAAIKAAEAELEQIDAREQHRLAREQTAARQRVASTREAVKEQAEATRRELAKAIVTEVFSTAPESVASKIARWRIEPTRVLTGEIKAAWDSLCERAKVELGERLGDHLLGAAFVESISASVPGAIVRLSEPEYASGQKAIGGLAAFRRALTPDAAELALVAVESALIVAASRCAGQVVEPHHVERAALRRTSATTRDLVAAYNAFDESRRQAEHARMVAEYVPPPPLSQRVMSWLSPGE